MSSGTWTYGVCGCFKDCGLCVVTYLLPCYTAARNAEAVGDNCVAHFFAASVPLLNIWCHASTRGKIRDQKRIDGTFLSDLILVLLCPHCTYIQEGQELKAPAPMAMGRE